jgi:site-specific recombinase XerD
MKPTDFANRLTAFLSEHLSAQRNASPNTIKSYGQAFALLLCYCRDHHRLSPQRVTLDHLTPEVILAFLDYLERRRHCSIATRNQRLASIRSFFQYLQDLEPARLLQCQRILAISGKRTPVSVTVDYLTPERMQALLARPSLTSRNGRRDAALLSLLYDAGLRVQELIDLSLADVRLDSPAQISVMGKGRKRRIVPLLSATIALLHAYLRDERPQSAERPLFCNRQNGSLTRAGVSYILRKYGNRTVLQNGDRYEGVSPHTFRHSKAMHLLQAGNPLAVIQSFLGHSDIRTTTIYAKADLAMTRAALEKTVSAIPDAPLPSWIEKPDLLSWLRSL